MTPKSTRPQGPAIRGSRRSAGSRSGLRSGRTRAGDHCWASASESARRCARQLVRHGGQELLPALLELLDALALEHLDHVGVADAERRQLVEPRRCLGVGAADGVAADLAVVGDRLEGLLRHRVDRPGGHQLDDVQGVVVGRSLTPVEAHSGRCGWAPASSSAFQRAVAIDLLERLVGQPGVGDGRLALERLGLVGADRVEAGVDLGVDPGDEERGDRGDRGQVVAVALRLLQPGR